jgi:hypothetical protein
MTYKVAGRPLKRNGKLLAVGDTISDIPAADAEVLVARGRLRKTAARPAAARTPAAKADDDK